MKIVAFSSDKDFEKFFNSLTSSGFEVCLLVSESAKKQGRNLKLSENPAVIFAQENKIPLITPSSLDQDTIDQISKTGAPVGFVFAYGKIIPLGLIEVFKNGIINVHPSLLPKLRGPSPIQWALLNNQSETGYSVMKINDKMDAGDIIYQEKIQINNEGNFDTLRESILNLAADKLPEVLNSYLSGNIKATPQEDKDKTFSKLISKNDGKLEPKLTAQEAYNKIRAFSHWPKTYFLIEGKRFIIHKATLENDKVKIIEIQPEGKKIMSFADFKNGYSSLLTKFPNFVNIS